MPETPDTDYFGLTRVGEGESLSKNGFAALDLDRVTIDDILHALTEHSHDAAPRLADPAGSPSVTTTASGGTLPPGTTLYYRVSYLDKWGLETTASTEVAITTPGALGSPEAPAISLESTSGTLGPGLYSYVATYVTAVGGESVAGPRTEVRITSGATNRLRIEIPPLTVGATAVRVYRSRPGQTQYYYLFETTDAFYYDDGVIEDATITVPGFNSTNSANSVEVTVPGGTLPVGVFGWRLYRSVSPGSYSGFNLVHTVVEGTTETSNDIRISWVDDGSALQRGEPREVSSTIGGGQIVTLNQIAGKFPLSATPRGAKSWSPFITGTAVATTEYARMRAPLPVSPISISGFFLDPPTTSPTGSQVALRLTDNLGAFVEMLTDGTSGQYYVSTFPLTDGGTFEAESGVRSANSAVPIVTDASASNAQAVELNAASEFVEYPLGTLDPGTYLGYVRIKSTTANPPLNDATVDVLSGSSVIATGLFTVGAGATPAAPAAGYANIGPVKFVVPTFGGATPTGSTIKIRVTKSSNDPATYLVDQFSYTAELVSLAAGDIRLTAEVGDIPTALYPAIARPSNPHWYFNKTHTYVRFPQPATPVPITAIAMTSDMVTGMWNATSDQPWLTITPANGNGSTAVLTYTVDFNSLNPGERAVAIVTIQSASHQAGQMQVVALKAPSDMGANVNVMVQY